MNEDEKCLCAGELIGITKAIEKVEMIVREIRSGSVTDFSPMYKLSDPLLNFLHEEKTKLVKKL